jgi:hypothetical protein
VNIVPNIIRALNKTYRIPKKMSISSSPIKKDEQQQNVRAMSEEKEENDTTAISNLII